MLYFLLKKKIQSIPFKYLERDGRKKKSFILNNFALQELEKGKISKIVYIPNNSYTENAMEIGFLPGC